MMREVADHAHSPCFRLLALCIAMSSGYAAPCLAASEDATEEGETTEVAVIAEPAKKSSDLIIVPIPQSNPAIGSGLAVASALIYKPKGSPQPWVTGLGGLYTSSKSWAVGAIQRANLAKGKIRLSGSVAYGNFNIDFYGVGSPAGRNEPVEINQSGWLAVMDGQVRIAPNLYAGLHYRLIDVDTKVDLAQFPIFDGFDIPDAQLNATSSVLGPIMIYDTRDNEFSAKKGEFVTIQYLQSFSAIGSDFSYGKLNAAANIYRPLDDKSVIAARMSFCSVDKGAPFFDICLYGSSKDLRGYATGRYRDNGSFATQVEYRRHIKGKFGVVGFAGVGGVSDKLTNFDNYRILPAAGVGLRYAASQQFGVNLSIDYAVGKHSSGLYIYIAEAF